MAHSHPFQTPVLHSSHPSRHNLAFFNLLAMLFFSRMLYIAQNRTTSVAIGMSVVHHSFRTFEWHSSTKGSENIRISIQIEGIIVLILLPVGCVEKQLHILADTCNVHSQFSYDYRNSWKFHFRTRPLKLGVFSVLKTHEQKFSSKINMNLHGKWTRGMPYSFRK